MKTGRKRLAFAVAGILLPMALCGQGTTIDGAGGRWKWDLSENGTAERLVFLPGGDAEKADTIPFFSGKETDGPSFYLREKGTTMDSVAPWTLVKRGVYRSAPVDGIVCTLAYLTDTENPTLRVTLRNEGHTPVQPERAGLKLGVDIYMDSYPGWFGKYFPTLMRNEKTHFWGYFQTPGGKTLGIVCPQPVASWSVDFNLGYRTSSNGEWFGGHRIESVNLDLLNALPLPQRHPQDLWQLRKGEERTWDISFLDLMSPDEVEPAVSRAADAPVLVFGKTSYRPDEPVWFEVWSPVTAKGARRPEVQVKNAREEEITVYPRYYGDGRYVTDSFLLPEAGLYTVTATAGGKTAEGILSVLHPWKWYMEQAREGALKYHQKASSHIESWMGFYSAFIAAKDFPSDSIDNALRDRFELLFDLLHDTVKMEPKFFESRIQNTAGTIGMLTDKYQAYGDVNDLERAARLADWMIESSQRQDGAYYNHGTVYTSVIYIAKSVLELAEVEKQLAASSPAASQWKERYERHYASAKRAVDQLVSVEGNFQTEGEHTFEDGMISCSALQIGMLALTLPETDTALRGYYTRAMLDILNSHDCLTQLKVPDARRRGGTMRFWEAQYDVQMLPNMFNSPHGWSGWRGYATYYAYLLTGEERWLKETFNAMGAFANLIDPVTGDLSWAFISDPYIQAEQSCAPDTTVTFETPTFGNPHPRLYPTRKLVIGEEYVPMVSDWQTVNTQDNDVHEVFKLIGEAALENAFVVERPDGTVVGYNCRVTRRGKKGLIVVPTEGQVDKVHFNVRNVNRASIDRGDGRIHNVAVEPMQWVDLGKL